MNATTPFGIVVRELEPGDFDRWDAFVAGCDEATFFHRAGWKSVIERAFGHRTHFLYAEADGQIEGILPLAEVRSRLFGHGLVALPFCVYGGIAAESAPARLLLDLAAQELAAKLGVGHLEYRNLAPQNPDWHGKDLYVTFRKELDPQVEQNLVNIPRKQRAMVRKGIKAGLVSELDDAGVERFFPVYAASVHRLGTPVFSQRYFRILREVFGADCEVMTVTKDGRPVSSVMSFYFRDEVLPYYGGSTGEAREMAGNDFMYWELMRRACERGCKVFDYGRSKRGSGSFDFKKNWGFEPRPLHYEYKLYRAKGVPDHNPMSPKYRLFIRLWQKMPLALANLIGPHIVKNLG
ncbi:MAG: FemAB family PEP-CTERM system-associated protein [Sulfuricella sp.]|nr:FemAB family PEP-CTERM system-associated protein [Sulfuricella sp.]